MASKAIINKIVFQFLKHITINLFFKVSLWLLIVVGTFIHFYKILDIPGGILNDEATVINYTTESFKKDRFTPYRESPHRVETLHGIMQSILPSFTVPEINNHRIYARVLCIFTIILFFIFTNQIVGQTWAFYSTIMLWLNFWFVFYSRILCSMTGIIPLFLLSSIIFLKIIRRDIINPSTSFFKIFQFFWLWPLFLFIINIIGFFYYTSFRIVILTQFIISLLYYKKYRTTIRIILFTGLLGVMVTVAIFLITDTPLELIFLRGNWNIKSLTERNILANLFYSLLVPLIKPPISYSYFSKAFMGDSTSYSFYTVTNYFILGTVYSFFYLIGLLSTIKNFFMVLRPKKYLKLSLLPTIYIILLFLFLLLIIGIAGPSYGRLLPWCLGTSILAGYGLQVIYQKIDIINIQWLKRSCVFLLVGILILIPIQTFNLLANAEHSPVIALRFNKYPVLMFEALQSDKSWQNKTKFVFCPHNYTLCKYYSHKISNLLPVRHYLDIKQTIKFIPDSSTFLKEKIYLLWPYAPDYNDYIFANMFKPLFNLNYELHDLNRHFNIEANEKIYLQNKFTFWKITIQP